MNIFGWITEPIQKLRAMRIEQLQLHQLEMQKMAALHAGIEDGTVTSNSLDAVTECLESMSMKPATKKGDTKGLKP